VTTALVIRIALVHMVRDDTGIYSIVSASQYSITTQQKGIVPLIKIVVI